MRSNCKVTYYRKMLQQFFTRASEHMGTSNVMGKGFKNAKVSAIFEHLLRCDSSITFDDIDISASNSNKLK